MVRTRFTEYSLEERDLLGAEEEESSFEVVRKVLRANAVKRTIGDVKKENEEIQKLMEKKKEKEKVKKLLEGRKTERDLRKYVHSELKALGKKVRKLLYGDTSDALSADIQECEISMVDSAPQQMNRYDCGVFVLKYMEAMTSANKINWEHWQSKMSRFRAELTDEILQNFADEQKHRRSALYEYIIPQEAKLSAYFGGTTIITNLSRRRKR
ncbi:putative ubiquitin-like-specific protease 1B [Platanthera guangdongensis]|uniref:Ubiquitin-like-specific protease 1B n=1 Tax=Platanthera guangdongensis TaxID=2320717 RepID=A0ABR2LYC6_9ASPA